jgi:DivIVA domain-containing protein
MALTPEDVVNKRFQPTKFREGYDQDEVDDFLDEVVVELRRLNQENEELRQRLIASDSRISELQRTAAQPAPAAFEQPVVASAPAPFQPAAVATVDPNIDAGNTNNLLQLARRLHEEHVREGVEKRDALIADGQAQAQRVLEEGQAQAARAVEDGTVQAARVIEDGNAQAARVLEEAQTERRNQIAQLDEERATLEERVEELRNFERDYRAKLKSYIEGQLHELDSSSTALVGAGGPSSVPVAPNNYNAQQLTPPPANYPGFAGN